MVSKDFSGSLGDAYPNVRGVISLSRVGFNAKGDQALVYVVKRAGNEGGSSYYVLLVKKNTAWEVEKKLNEMMI